MLITISSYGLCAWQYSSVNFLYVLNHEVVVIILEFHNMTLYVPGVEHAYNYSMYHSADMTCCKYLYIMYILLIIIKGVLLGQMSPWYVYTTGSSTMLYSDNLFQSPKNDNYIHSASCDNFINTGISASVCVRSLSVGLCRGTPIVKNIFYGRRSAST